MKVLILNCGSSTLKFAVYEARPTGDSRETSRLVCGVAEFAGADGRLRVTLADVHEDSFDLPLGNHKEATHAVLEWIQSSALLAGEELDVVGHRVVHGGARFVAPTLLTEDVADALDALTELAPLHNGPALAAIRACRELLGERLPNVAVFDTAFHHTLPPWAAQYAIPAELARRCGVRRFGFHGLAHQQMVQRCAELTGIPQHELNAVTLQLGNGCSATAICGGRSVDTSMGLTPLEGLMMGTRSGNVDPSLVGHLVRRAGLSVEEVEQCLTTQSGLLGVSGRSHNMRILLEAARQGDQRAGLAIEMYCHRVRQYVGAYFAILGGAHVLAFGGGIGENAPSIREQICAGMNWCGLVLDPVRNLQSVGREGCISANDSAIQVLVIAVDEERVILEETVRLLSADEND